jgi:hypothetical protein
MAGGVGWTFAALCRVDIVAANNKDRAEPHRDRNVECGTVGLPKCHELLCQKAG